MSIRVSWACVLLCAVLLAFGAWLPAQETEGRVFLPTPETVSIHEFNSLEGADGDAIATGTIVPDLSGHGLHATVEVNDVGDLQVNAGDINFDDPAGANREARRVATAELPMRVAVNNDNDAYEMEADDDFSIELYINREDVANAGNWGILAGTWHSRNLADDSVGDPDNNGAWYGYGLISYGGNQDWSWVLSPVTDGNPIVGLTNGAEKTLLPWMTIDQGRHYLVLSVDRTAQSAVGYLDGAEVCRFDNLDPTWTFTTPTDDPGRDHARFIMFNGEDDLSRNVYRPPPAGVGLDAVRVQRKALSAGEIFEIWENIQGGASSPPAEDLMQAILIPSSVTPVVDQCVVLNGEESFPGGGETITKYEWKIGDGAFEEGESTKEIFFDTADPSEVTVSLRITNSAAATSTDDDILTISNQELVTDMSVSLDGEELHGSLIIVSTGSVLTLDASASASVVPVGAFLCPLDDGIAVPASPIEAYEWDLDGDGSPDNTTPTFDLPPLDVGEFTIALTVRNDDGEEGSASVDVKVTDSGGNSDVFHNTDDTIFHVEFNDEEPGFVPDQTVMLDLSDNALDLTIVDPVGDSLEVQNGAPQFSTNLALTYVQGGVGPRGEVQDDGDLFEMGAEDDFTFEIYVRPGEADLPEWGDVAGTFRARTDATEESDRYGWGIIKSNLNNALLNTQGYGWLVASGAGGQDAEHQVPFNMQKGAYNYVACVVDRVEQVSSVYVNGEFAGQLAGLDPAWTFETPQGFPHADFFVFTREQVEGEFSNCPPGLTVDAIRLQGVALTAEEVLQNWEDISDGVGANGTEPQGPLFHRGDPNDDGDMNITDGIYVLNFLFLGGPDPTCNESADPNDDGVINITDGIFILNFLFLGGPPPADPGPPADACGPDPDGSTDLGCASYTNC